MSSNKKLYISLKEIRVEINVNVQMIFNILGLNEMREGRSVHKQKISPKD